MDRPATTVQIELRDIRHKLYRISDCLQHPVCKEAYNLAVRASDGQVDPIVAIRVADATIRRYS